MKKLTGIVAVAFIAGVIGGGIGDRIADEVWAPKSAHAASGFSYQGCQELEKRLSYSRPNRKVWAVVFNEHC